VVEISRRQMDALCGNVIELEDGRGHPVLALSSQSYHAFTGGYKSYVLADPSGFMSCQGIRRSVRPHAGRATLILLRLHADDQRRQLHRHLAALHHAPIDTLEFIGGGGVRCSLGEVF
jgi:hypothetical protein